MTRLPPFADPGFGQFVQVGASAVHFQRWGDWGSAIVLVPGFPESSVVWSAVGPLLGQNYIVYALDLPGDGPMILGSQADLVDRFVEALHLRQPILVGRSLGAAVVGSVALEHPGDVGRVVFADGDGLKLNLGPKWLRSLILDSPYMTTLLRIGSR